MYIAICTMKKIKCGEPLIIKKDSLFDEPGAFTVGGEFLGYVSQEQPDGCLGYETVCGCIGANRVFAKGAVAFDNLLVVSTDSPVFNTTKYVREGYGLLMPVY